MKNSDIWDHNQAEFRNVFLFINNNQPIRTIFQKENIRQKRIINKNYTIK